MPTEIPKAYEPKTCQEKWLGYWEEQGFFDADPNSDKPQHTIMIPLPNVTGALHMGHALNGTVQDLITRWKRMQGFEALWMPGTDHAGIATQAVVERRMLEEEGLTRHDIGREALVNRIWTWKDAYEKRILNQLKQLGASCDWRRVRFTLDDVCTKAVRRTFFKMFRDGLIFRGKRLVNWDPHLQTAVADDEVFNEDVNGQFWTFSYPIVDSDKTIVFSTTRPETMLGDTAVCVHPTDERYTDLIGKMVRIPLNGREIPIIADGLLAEKDKGTGAVKLTPAHDPKDYACWGRNKDKMGDPINILNPDCTINEEGGDYEGLPYEEARTKVVEAMEAAGHFHGVEDRVIPTPHSDRSKHVIQPYLSDQWFVKMDELAQSAIDAVDDKRVKFFPNRYENTYKNWLGEKRDWCISRQLWWGHRIPIWSKPYDGDKPMGEMFAYESISEDQCLATIAEGIEPGTKVMLVCVADGFEDVEKQLEADGLEQDPDVLDTWFSSALWPHATLGWPNEKQNPPMAGEISNSESQISDSGKNEVLDYFYPGSVLITSRDIITLWVARMVLAGLYNMGDIPFSHVCIHPKILDGFGQTMSKSKGNGADPMDLIDKYGTDAVRFTIASFAGETQDVRLPMAYECPHCQEEIPQALDGKGPMVKPRSLKGTLKGTSGPVLMPCPKCKAESQFSTPQYEADPNQPVARMVSERFDYGRNFCNKLWNASRFAMMNLEGYTPGAVADEELRLEDRWILSRLSTMTEEVNTCLGRYQLDAATRAIYNFTWNEFCDWYLEMLKPRFRDEGLKPVAQRMLVGVLDNLLRLLHPFAPFITEELWSRLAELAPQRGLLEPVDAESAVMIAAWPEPPQAWQDAGLEKRFETLQELIVSVRNIRAHYKISPKEPLKLYLQCADDVAADVQSVESQFDNLAKTVLEAAGASIEQPKLSASFTMGDVNGYISLEGVIDAEAEVTRLKKELEKKEKLKGSTEKKLSNEKFVNSAPADIVDGVRVTLGKLVKEIESIQTMINDLSAG
jgi:valyl-tRNA synthetase